MHPVIEEINRVPRGDAQIRGEVFGRWRQTLVYEVQPQLDEREALKARVAELEAQLAAKTRKGAA